MFVCFQNEDAGTRTAERAGVQKDENLRARTAGSRAGRGSVNRSRGPAPASTTLASVVVLRQHQAPGAFTLVALLGHKARMAAAAIAVVASFNVCNKKGKNRG